jgi:glycosyltransferase involved in cell wall biosynthesis
LTSTGIVGIALVRDEDLFVERVLRNVLPFCDELIVADHRSRDRTPQILARLAAEEPKVQLHRIDHPSASHDLISPYAGQPVWVLGVDGDEVYDPLRLAQLRDALLRGDFDDWWLVSGNMLHCRELDLPGGTASGYLAPPSRSVTKLYNFGLLESWRGPAPERLHGGEPRFRPPYSADLRYELFRERAWEESPFRCLHVCFLRRSSRERRRHGVRKNPSEVYYGTALDRLRRDARALLGLGKAEFGKQQVYMRGEPATVDPAPFFPDYD